MKSKEDKYIKQIEEFKNDIKNFENYVKKYKNKNEDFPDNFENELFYTCDYCNCKHVLCKDCLNIYLNSK